MSVGIDHFSPDVAFFSGEQVGRTIRFIELENGPVPTDETRPVAGISDRPDSKLDSIRFDARFFELDSGRDIEISGFQRFQDLPDAEFG